MKRARNEKHAVFAGVIHRFAKERDSVHGMNAKTRKNAEKTAHRGDPQAWSVEKTLFPARVPCPLDKSLRSDCYRVPSSKVS